MYAVKTFKGAQLDLQHFKGATVRGYEIEFLEDDCSPMDTSGYVDIVINVRHKAGGTIINTYSVLNGDIVFGSPDSVVYWTVESEDFEDLPRLEYYHECFGIFSNDQKDALFYGVSDLK